MPSLPIPSVLADHYGEEEGHARPVGEPAVTRLRPRARLPSLGFRLTDRPVGGKLALPLPSPLCPRGPDMWATHVIIVLKLNPIVHRCLL